VISFKGVDFRVYPLLFFAGFHIVAVTYCNLVNFKIESDNNILDKYLTTVGAIQKWRMFDSIPWFATHEVTYIKGKELKK